MPSLVPFASTKPERCQLYDLARAAGTTPRIRRRPRQQQIRPAVQSLLDAMTDAPAFVRNGRLDILAINRLGEALYRPAFRASGRPVNLARFCFLDPAADDFYPDWNAAADTTVALLHTEAGLNPHDKALSDLIGELAVRSDDFRARWAPPPESRGEGQPSATPRPAARPAGQPAARVKKNRSTRPRNRLTPIQTTPASAMIIGIPMISPSSHAHHPAMRTGACARGHLRGRPGSTPVCSARESPRWPCRPAGA
jgi:hypothetical protein